MKSIVAIEVSERAYRKWLDRRDLTIEELVETAESMLPEIAPLQTRYKVRERPDVRTIRYYITENLLPKPFSYEGGRARYGGTHLLRLLLIKRMQAEHETLQRIAQKLKNASDDQVIAALREVTRAGKKQKAATPSHLHLVDRTAEPEIDETEEGSPVERASDVKRLELSSGATVEVPEHILGDTSTRRRLADDLANLAAWLRASLPKDE
jgi:DNA-binding transcriptional MerR regulator